MNKERGAALIYALMLMSMIMILGVAIFSRSISERAISERFVDSTQAFWLEDGAFQEAMFGLNTGNWTSGWAAEGVNKTKSASLGSGNYTVTVTDIDGSNPQVTAMGSVRGIQRTIEATTVKEIVTASLFQYSVNSKGAVTVGGSSYIDSYDSSQGSYGGGNVFSNGNIGTLSSSAGAISLSGNANVNGNVSIGPGGTVSITQSAAVTGTITDDNTSVINPIEVPAELVSLSNSGNYSLGGHSTGTLPSGDYKFSSFIVGGSADLTIQGMVRLYLTDSLSVGGTASISVALGATLIIYNDGLSVIHGNGLVNETNLPKNLQLYSTYVDPGFGVQVTGSSDFYGVIYASDTKVQISGSSDLFGSIVGKEVAVSGNVNVHYDEDLKNGVPGGSGSSSTIHYRTQSWREQNNPYPLN